jgi:hypothetical protein
MAIKYEVIPTDYGSTIKRTDEDGKVWFIPLDESNTDYQAYLAWKQTNTSV